MCSIIGYYGVEQAAPLLVSGLYRMEYRGYDSVGVSTLTKKQIPRGRTKRIAPTKEFKIETLKGVGKVKDVNRQLGLSKLQGLSGIGHTRWATHGEATVENAHPHHSSDNSISIVHNGIIENYERIKRRIYQNSSGEFSYLSETDSEVIANLLQFHYNGSAIDSVIATVKELEGQYSFIALFDEGKMVAVRNNKPLILGVADHGYMVSSDVLGFIQQTNKAIYPENKEIILIDDSGIQIFDFDGNKVDYSIVSISRELSDVYKGEYAHFTIKEIYEQGSTIKKAGAETKTELDLLAEFSKHAKTLFLTGSGTSYNAALVAKYLLSKYVKIPCETIMSSEAAFSPLPFDHQSVLIAMSQSGESADVMDTVSLAKNAGAKILSIVNTMTSSLPRMSYLSVGLNCGPEIGVAATKSFTAQLSIIYQIIEKLSQETFDVEQAACSVENFLSDKSQEENISNISKDLKNVNDIYVLGRGIHYPIAVEAALKLKEITYVHAEGIAGGELKHGPLALMDKDSYVVLLNPNDETYAETINSARQIKARGTKIIGVSDKESELYDYFVKLPEGSDLYPILEIVPLQMLSYYLCIEKNMDPDYPRNLAKSVTVK